MNLASNRGTSFRIGAAGLFISALVLSAGHALAQNAPSDSVLRGPAVKDNAVPGEKGSFSKGAKGKKGREMDAPLPPRMFLGALNVLRGDQVAEKVRLTPEQDEKIRSIQKEFGATVEAYMSQHGAEVRELMPQLAPEARREAARRMRGALHGTGIEKPGKPAKGGPDQGGDPMSTDAPTGTPQQQEAAKARLKELFENAPSPKDAQAKVWNVLTDSQRPLVEAELKRLREQPGKGENPQRPGAAKEGAQKPAEVDLSQLPEPLRQRLESLPPEKREEAIRRFQERRKGGNGGPGQDKPAPNMDDVNVPNPK